MTVGDLRKKLAEYPDDTPVMAEWEGVCAYVQPGSFYSKSVSKLGDEERDCLIVNVDVY